MAKPRLIDSTCERPRADTLIVGDVARRHARVETTTPSHINSIDLPMEIDMKKTLLAVGIGAALLLSGTLGLTQDAKAPATAGGKPAAAQSMPSMGQMDEHMKKMQALHDKMMSASTPEERQKAMEEARKEMQDSMTMMQPMMQGGGMMGGGMMGQKGKPADSNAQMQMMGKRMDMMQMMMQMMMDQQGMMGQPKGSEPAPKK
jgi:hypothetical protein